MIVNWTDEAKASYKNVVNNILDDWNIEIATQLEEDVNVLIRNLEDYEHFCPPSKKDKNLRRCVISKQTSLLYEVNKTHIDLVAFFDNRTNHQH